MQNNASEPGQAGNISRIYSPGTSIFQDGASKREFRRLDLQHRLITEGMGGLLPEQPNAARFESVLDVGCGTGTWLIEMAQKYPACSRLVGVDANLQMIAYARQQAEERQLGERVEFQVMDVLSMLDFSPASFDLVNMRFGSTFVRNWEWSNLLNKFRHVMRPGGMVCISEMDGTVQSTSPALTNLLTLVSQALNHAGHLFTEGQANVATGLAGLLTNARFAQVQTRTVQLKFLPVTQQARDFSEFLTITLRSLLPFLRKWLRLPENYEDLYQQMLDELCLPDFAAAADLVTAWGTLSNQAF